MPEILKALHPLQQDRMPQVEVRRGRIKPRLDPERLSCLLAALKPFEQLLLAVEADAAAAEFCYLFFKPSTGTQTPYIAVSLMRVSRTTCTRTSPIVSDCSSIRRAKRCANASKRPSATVWIDEHADLSPSLDGMRAAHTLFTGCQILQMRQALDGLAQLLLTGAGAVLCQLERRRDDHPRNRRRVSIARQVLKRSHHQLALAMLRRQIGGHLCDAAFKVMISKPDPPTTRGRRRTTFGDCPELSAISSDRCATLIASIS